MPRKEIVSPEEMTKRKTYNKEKETRKHDVRRTLFRIPEAKDLTRGSESNESNTNQNHTKIVRILKPGTLLPEQDFSDRRQEVHRSDSDINLDLCCNWNSFTTGCFLEEELLTLDKPITPDSFDPSSWVYMATEVPSEEFWTKKLQFDSDDDEVDDEDIDDILSQMDSETLINIFRVVSETSLKLTERYPSFFAN